MRKVTLSIFISQFLLFIFSPCVFAWGHLNSLKTAWLPAYLISPVVNEHQIRYCIHIGNDNNFLERSVSIQVEMALRLWLTSIKNLNQYPVTITHVLCKSPRVDLMVDLDHESLNSTSTGAYCDVKWNSGNCFSYLKIETNYHAQEKDRTYKTLDFFELAQVGTLDDFEEVLRKISVTSPETLFQFASRMSLDHLTVYYSTYPTFIHELGHAFGLCDTYEPMLSQLCDLSHSSKEHPSSVMKESSYFYLTPDDQEGMRMLFKRFSKPANRAQE